MVTGLQQTGGKNAITVPRRMGKPTIAPSSTVLMASLSIATSIAAPICAISTYNRITPITGEGMLLIRFIVIGEKARIKRPIAAGIR